MPVNLVKLAVTPSELLHSKANLGGLIQNNAKMFEQPSVQVQETPETILTDSLGVTAFWK